MSARLPISGAVILSLVCWASHVSAQAPVVTGRILDGSTRQPVALATVALLDTAMTMVDQAFTNERGAFVLEAPRPGPYFVLADRIGYKRAVDGILELGKGGSITIEFYLRPQPFVLDSLVVAASRQRTIRHLEMAGFYERMQGGHGYFITPEQIARRPLVDAGDLLRAVPGVRVLMGQLGATVVFTRATKPGNAPFCRATLYIDGARIAQGTTLDAVVDLNDIEAIEIYTGPGSLPLEFGGTTEGCGALLIWTRK